jgi:hypothetical protein
VNLVIASRAFFGVSAPVFVWIEAGVLLFFAIIAMIALFWKVPSIRTNAKRLVTSLSDFRKPSFGVGISPSDVEKADQRHFEQAIGPRKQGAY